MAIVASVLARIKSDPLACLGGADFINGFFTRAGHVWRRCTLDPATTLRLFIIQVLNGNAAMTELRHLAGFNVPPASYCEARARLPVAAVAGFVDSVSGDCIKSSEGRGSWRGHRVFAADATSASTPDEPVLQDLWPQPTTQKRGCGFPTVKLLGLLDLVTGMIVQLTLMSMNVHEMSQLPGLHAALRAGDLLLADRGFCSFWHLAMLAKSSVFAVFRMHQRQIVDFTPDRPHRTGKEKRKRGKRGKRCKRSKTGIPTSRYVRRLGHEDQLVEWPQSAIRPQWMSDADYAAMPATLLVRELRYRIVERGRRTQLVTIATTLVDAVRYPKGEIARLYGLRWEVETNFRDMKTTMKMDELKCHTVDGILKELMVFVLVYNLIRARMVQAAARQGVEVSRISFIDALRDLRECCRPPAKTGPIDLVVNPIRPGRWNPRVVKRRPKPFDRMNRPRSEYREPSPLEEVIA
jgi:hypothetical protein